MADRVKTATERLLDDREFKAVEIYCFFSEGLKSMGIKTPKNSTLSYADVLVLIFFSFTKHGGNFKEACLSYKEKGYCNILPDYTRILRQINLLKSALFRLMQGIISSAILSPTSEVLLVDSLPVPLTQNHRKSKRIFDEKLVGFNAMTKSTYIGVKIHMVSTLDRRPVFLYVDFASTHDLTALQKYAESLIGSLHKKRGDMPSFLIGDKAYNSKEFEMAMETAGLKLEPIRKKCKDSEDKKSSFEISKRTVRRNIETAFSFLKSYLTNTVKTRSFDAFIEKIQMAFCIYAIASSPF